MNETAQIIEWIFSSPFIWMTILGIITAHSFRVHGIESSTPYAPNIEEKSENTMGRRMLLSFMIGAMSALIIYITGATLNFIYILGIWLVAFIFIANSKVSVAFLFTALILGVLSFIIDGYQMAYMVLRYAGAYQIALGLMYLIGKKETYPVMQKQRDGTISGEHMFKEVWLLPAAGLSLGDVSIQIFSYILIAMLLFCEIRIKCTTPEKYFKQNGIFMTVTGIMLLVLSFITNFYVYLTIQFLLIPVAIVIWTIYKTKTSKKNKFVFVASDVGVQVLYVYANTPANVMNLEIGDIIVSLNGKRVVRYKAIEAILDERPPFIWLDVLRDGNNFEVEYKDYQKGIDDLGIVHTPFNPSKFELYPRPGFFARQNIRIKSLIVRRNSKN